MKVCIINNIYPPYARGGAEQVVERTVAGLLGAGHEVVLITSTPDEPGIDKTEGLTIYRIRPGNIFFYTNAHKYNWGSRLLWHVIDIFNFGAAKRIKQVIEEEKPDVVHTHNLMGLSFLLPGVIRKLGIRHIHTVHDVQLVEPSGMILKQYENTWHYHGLGTRAYTALMRKLVGSPAVVISPSQFLREFYLTRGFFTQSEVAIVRNPLTFDLAAAEEKTGDGPTTFLYVGQIESHKGVGELVQAFLGLEKNLSVELHIVGGGSELENIKKMSHVDSRITVYGRVERPDLPGIFAKMDVTVVPSLCYENSPTVIFESFASGVPVLASNIEGIAELIEEGKNGLTFPAGNIMALTERLKWCHENKTKLASMRASTQASIEGLSLGEYITRLEKIYQV